MRAIAGALALLVVMGACDSGSTENLPDVDSPREISVTGPFDNEGSIPEKYTCDGANVAPELDWTVVPEVREYALIVADPDAPGGTFVHWVIWGLPSGHIGEGQVPDGAHEGENGGGERGYTGPCPPEGDELHHYEWNVYGLRSAATANLPDGATATDLLNAIDCCVAASGTLTGTYAR